MVSNREVYCGTEEIIKETEKKFISGKRTKREAACREGSSGEEISEKNASDESVLYS